MENAEFRALGDGEIVPAGRESERAWTGLETETEEHSSLSEVDEARVAVDIDNDHQAAVRGEGDERNVGTRLPRHGEGLIAAGTVRREAREERVM
jgi:hypothetical protein